MTRCGCGAPEALTILYTLRQGPNAGDVVCGPCVMRAGGSAVLHPVVERELPRFQRIRYQHKRESRWAAAEAKERARLDAAIRPDAI